MPGDLLVMLVEILAGLALQVQVAFLTGSYLERGRRLSAVVSLLPATGLP